MPNRLKWASVADGFVAASGRDGYVFLVIPQETPENTGRYIAAFVEVSRASRPSGSTSIVASWSPGDYETAFRAMAMFDWLFQNVDLDRLVAALEPMDSHAH